MNMLLNVLSEIVPVVAFLLFVIAGGSIQFGLLFIGLGKSAEKKASSIQGTIVGRCADSKKYNSGNNTNADVLLEKDDGNKGYPVFTYCVDDTAYKRAGVISRNISELDKKIYQCEKVKVYYSPEAPDQAWMSKENPPVILGRRMVVFGLISLAVAIASTIAVILFLP